MSLLYLPLIVMDIFSDAWAFLQNSQKRPVRSPFGVGDEEGDTQEGLLKSSQTNVKNMSHFWPQNGLKLEPKSRPTNSQKHVVKTSPKKGAFGTKNGALT